MIHIKKVFEGITADTSWRNPDVKPKQNYELFLINDSQECEMTDSAPFENMEDLLERYDDRVCQVYQV